MTWFGELRRRLSAMFGRLRRPAITATAQRSLPPTPVVLPATTAAQATSAAESSVLAAVSSAAASGVQAVESVVAKQAPPPPVVGPMLDPNLGQLKARQFFARMVAATPAGLTIDFTDWQSASVERYFIAMTSPGLTRRREAPTSGVEQVSLTNAFQGFEWD